MSIFNEKIKSVTKLLLLSLAIGAVSGIVGARFSHLIGQATTLRTQNSWIIYLLPVAGLLVVAIYKIFSVSGVGTNQVLDAANGKGKLSPTIFFAIFIASAISHLFGASVGREGAALQLGGGLAVAVGNFSKISKAQKQALVRAGMAGVFSAVFGTPIAAFFFALEVACVGSIQIMSILPCLISSFSAFWVARFLGATAERFPLETISTFSFSAIWKIALLTVLCVVLGTVFCKSLHFCEKIFKKTLKNEYLRIFVGGSLILVLTLIIGNQDYNGAGVNIIEHIFENAHFRPEAFLLKLIFTCISVGCGFKGGEIVPTLFIGATFGALVASILGLPIVFGAAMGMVLLFCCVTNCPLASIFLGAEIFSFIGFWYLIPFVVITFLISGKTSLYHAQQRKILKF